MPLTLNVGISKKLGLPDYGSVGAICNVSVELDAALLTQDTDGFQRHVHNAYAACAKAVNDELARHKPSADAGSNGNTNRVGSNGGTNGNGSRRSTGRSATQSQVRAIHAIANRQRIDLTAELRSRFGVDRPDDLAITEASELIDSMKATANSNGGRR